MSDAPPNPEVQPQQDLFHHGVIAKLFPTNNTGFVRTASGHEVPFSYELVILLGDVKKPGELKEGMEVGYDLTWTSKGLRISKINVRPRAPAPQSAVNLKGEGSKGQDLPSEDLPDKNS